MSPTAIGANAVVDASNKICLGDSNVSVIEGEVAFTFTSDVNQKENFPPVDGEQALEKIGQLNLESWNFKGHDPSQFRHYGPTAQEFFAAFGDDGFGVVGTETTINSGDIAGVMMIAIQALEKRNAALQQRNDDLEARLTALEQTLGLTEATSESLSSLSFDNSVIWMIGAGLGLLIGGPGLVLWYRIAGK